MKSAVSYIALRRLGHGMVPLLLSLAVSQAYAADVVKSGANGAAGVDGSTTSAATNGASAPLSAWTLGPNGDASNTLTLAGGNGGQGGNGGPGFTNSVPGSGGDGGAVQGAVSSAVAAGAVRASVTAVGGNGGSAGGLTADEDYNTDYLAAGASGNGGAAQASSSAVGHGNGAVQSSAFAIGGNGGSAEIFAPATFNGIGGTASATAYGRSDSGDVTVAAGATGGDGGGVMGLGGRGADAVMIDAVSGATSGVLTLSQSATGGNGGARGNSSFPIFTSDNNGGSATSTLTLKDGAASALRGSLSATGGNGGDVPHTDFSLTPGGAGGVARATLTLASTVLAAPLVGTVAAVGGASGLSETSALAGGDAAATAVLTGRGTVTGTARATGGQGGATTAIRGNGAAGGNATADLTLIGKGLVSGTAEANGGASGGFIYFDNSPGGADASLSLSGAGAIGRSSALGGNANSRIASVTTGALATDVVGTATGFFSATSTVGVQSAGAAGVTAASYAYGDDHTGDGGNSGAAAVSGLTIVAGGDIQGISYAGGGNGLADFHAYRAGGSAVSDAHAVTTGAHAVSLTSAARGGDSMHVEWMWVPGGAATATAYGSAGSGVVNVSADARGGRGDADSPYGNMIGNGNAAATAITTQAGGVATARAIASGKDVYASALAQGVGGRYSATAGGVLGATAGATASTRYDAALVALPALDGATRQLSNVSAGPLGADRATLLSGSPVVDSQLLTLAGVGAQGAASGAAVDSSTPLQFSTSGGFAVSTTAAEHLLIGFISSTFLGGGFDALDLSITANGATLYAHTFTTLAEASLFFSDKVLDLGLLGAGKQDVLISSTYSFIDAGGFAFNYGVGTGLADHANGGPTAVPEPASWMMLLIGLGGLTLVARRRKMAGVQ